MPGKERDPWREPGQLAVRSLTAEQRRQLRKTYQMMMQSTQMHVSIMQISEALSEQLRPASPTFLSSEAREAMDLAVTRAVEPFSRQLREQFVDVAKAQIGPIREVVRDAFGAALGPDPFGVKQLQRDLAQTLLNRRPSHLSPDDVAQLAAHLVEVQLDQSLPDPDAETEPVRQRLAAEFHAIDAMARISRRQPRDARNQARLAKAALASSLLEGVRPSPATVKQLLLLVLEEDVEAEEAALDQAQEAIRTRVETNQQRNAES
ncbi:hypothetical protein GCM10022399_41990 [Terrabacter ginsenosidimutans]|uniref:DUF222 domain-containing protein n=1 Tax=Terrabacter ginsenosidimutans TaxID=490575 RepID=A0ABP7EMJ4_9MICO